MNEYETDATPGIRDYAVVGMLLACTVFGAVTITKLGVDWTREGIRTVKEKKNSKKAN